jgi:hypothetical protein
MIKSVAQYTHSSAYSRLFFSRYELASDIELFREEGLFSGLRADLKHLEKSIEPKDLRDQYTSNFEKMHD